MTRLYYHVRYFWWVYVIVGVVLLLAGAISEKVDRNAERQKAVDDPTINYTLISEIDDCKLYQLKTDRDTKFMICKTSRPAMGIRR